MGFDSAIAGWEKVGAVDAKKLSDARLEAHWASQVIAAAGVALVPAQPDHSHTSLEWRSVERMLAGQVTEKGARVALRLGDMSLHVMIDGNIRATFELAGKTLEDSLAWAKDKLDTKLTIPTYDMPEHPVNSGAPFSQPDKAALEELARYYANAALFESVVSIKSLGASPVRCWPHHFDIATLVTLDPEGGDPESARSIGFGMSPGDTNYAEPYFYINPWPFPEQRQGYPKLEGGGHWHTREWFGAVLPASSIQSGSAQDQAQQVFAYIKSAFATERLILEAL